MLEGAGSVAVALARVCSTHQSDAFLFAAPLRADTVVAPHDRGPIGVTPDGSGGAGLIAPSRSMGYGISACPHMPITGRPRAARCVWSGLPASCERRARPVAHRLWQDEAAVCRHRGVHSRTLLTRSNGGRTISFEGRVIAGGWACPSGLQPRAQRGTGYVVSLGGAGVSVRTLVLP